MELIKITPRFILEVLKYDYSKKMKERYRTLYFYMLIIILKRWGDCFFRQIIRANDYSGTNAGAKLGEKHAQLASKKRKAMITAEAFEPIFAEDVNMKPTPENQPILFENIHFKETKENITDTTDVESSFLEADNSSYK